MNGYHEVPVASIDPNPYQPRQHMDEAALAELAHSIQTLGLLQPPMARRVGDRWQLVFGHRRFAAWKIVQPVSPFPVEEVEISDQQMAEAAAAENGQREDLNPIEKAGGIQKLICEFGLTQLHAGKFYKLTTQGAVSNVLRLLKLTPHIQKLTADGTLPERLARQLIFISTINPKQADELITNVLDSAMDEDDELDYADLENGLQRELTAWMRKHGAPIDHDEMYPATWNAVGVSFQVKKEWQSARACAGCEFYFKGVQRLCMRPACHAAKLEEHAKAEVKKLEKKLGIPAAMDGDGAKVFWTGDYEGREQTEQLVKSKAGHLRLMPFTDKQSVGWQRLSILGSRWVALATVEPEAIKAEKKPTKPSYSYTPPTKEELEKRAAQEKKRLAHAHAIVNRVAPVLATKLPDANVLAVLYARDANRADIKKFLAMKGDAQKEHFAKEFLLSALRCQWHSSGNERAELITLLTPLKLKLPAGWDAEPEAKPVASSQKGKKK